MKALGRHDDILADGAAHRLARVCGRLEEQRAVRQQDVELTAADADARAAVWHLGDAEPVDGRDVRAAVTTSMRSGDSVSAMPGCGREPGLMKRSACRVC